MKVLIVTTGSRGDVQPFVALARGLTAAGHEATLAAPRRFGALVEPYQVDFAPLDDSVFAVQDEVAGKGTRAAITAVRKVKPLMRAWLDDLATLRDRPADIVVYAPKTLGAPHLADRMGVASLAALTVPLYQPTSHFALPIVPVRLPRTLNKLSWHVAAAVEAPWRGMVRTWRAQALGLPGRAPGFTQRVAEGGVLNAWSPRLLPVPPDWPPSAEPLGFLPLPAEPGWRPPERLTRFLEEGEPPIYVGFGSVVTKDAGTLTATVLEALRLTGRRGVLATGWGALRDAELREDVLVMDAVPHEWLLPRTALAVHHGGVGTVAAAMRAGIAQVVRPFLGDQPFWARRVHALGIAAPPLTKLTPHSLAEAIEQADARAEAARELGRRVRAEDGVAAAVRAIECAGGG
ncbi:glycosyltransferase family 1 protein [Nonomuraea sp. K274]|uniref:Glycosyltransferase family 1 protein n=1 Tax=Nonomuraea cypriaca TaxID=1187855 RepID=A0A931AHF0_9ACTN|nr:glycosyltransferase [Nonomuraea cypriaca]MBF8190349.1 glycosyltransferase family 1 protein [Nonomuraea cypriaca]